jgi:hypothetical protein
MIRPLATHAQTRDEARRWGTEGFVNPRLASMSPPERWAPAKRGRASAMPLPAKHLPGPLLSSQVCVVTCQRDGLSGGNRFRETAVPALSALAARKTTGLSVPLTGSDKMPAPCLSCVGDRSVRFQQQTGRLCVALANTSPDLTVMAFYWSLTPSCVAQRVLAAENLVAPAVRQGWLLSAEESI